MIADEIAVNAIDKCILFINGIRPFNSYKHDLRNHPYYKWTARADKKYAFDLEKHAKNYGKARLTKNTKIAVYEII